MKNLIAQALIDPYSGPEQCQYCHDWARPETVTEGLFKLLLHPSVYLLPGAVVTMFFLILLRNQLSHRSFFFTNFIIYFVVYIGLAVAIKDVSHALRSMEPIIAISFHILVVSLLGYAIGFARWMIYKNSSPEISKPSFAYLSFLIVGLAIILLIGTRVTVMVY